MAVYVECNWKNTNDKRTLPSWLPTKVVGFQLSAKNTTTICFKKPFNYLHIRYLQPWVLPPHQKEAVQGNTEMSIFNIQFSIFNIQGDTETLI